MRNTNAVMGVLVATGFLAAHAVAAEGGGPGEGMGVLAFVFLAFAAVVVVAQVVPAVVMFVSMVAGLLSPDRRRIRDEAKAEGRS